MPRKTKKVDIVKRLERPARAITKAVGATNLAKYAGQSLAKRKNPKVKRTVTKRQARNSGIALAANIASLAAGGAAAGALRAAKGVRAARAAAKRPPKSFKMKGLNGKKKTVRVTDRSGGKGYEQIPRKTRKPRFRITRRK